MNIIFDLQTYPWTFDIHFKQSAILVSGMKHGKAMMRVWQNKVVIISLIEANKFEIFVCSCLGLKKKMFGYGGPTDPIFGGRP